MSEIDDLQAQRERLLLERDVRRLEQRRKIELSASKWSWWWIAPLTAISGFFFLASVMSVLQGDNGPVGIWAILIVLSVLGLMPVLVKARYR